MPRFLSTASRSANVRMQGLSTDLITRGRNEMIRDWMVCSFEITDEQGEPAMPAFVRIPNPSHSDWHLKVVICLSAFYRAVRRDPLAVEVGLADQTHPARPPGAARKSPDGWLCRAVPSGLSIGIEACVMCRMTVAAPAANPVESDKDKYKSQHDPVGHSCELLS